VLAARTRATRAGHDKGEMMGKTVLVVAEARGNGLRKTALEALGAARMVAERTGADVHAVLIGAGTSAPAATLAAHGAAVAHAIDAPAFATYSSEAYTQALAKLAREIDAAVVLFADSSFGKDLAPAVAVRLDAALATDVIAIDVQPDGYLKVVHPIYTGKVNAEYQMQTKSVQVVSVRPNVFKPAPAGGNGRVETHAWNVERPPRAVVKEVVATSGGKIELGEADIIVSGGRSLKSAENFAIIEQLAAVLGAAVGASRAAVDAGYQPHSRQVGQTGKVVNPSLYVACGISGAIQHLVGMRTSKVIVAINKDPSAPIFQNADYGVVGDLFEVVPALTQELRTALGK
jgi:electron transfer flavoprotein alpha subunit